VTASGPAARKRRSSFAGERLVEKSTNMKHATKTARGEIAATPQLLAPDERHARGKALRDSAPREAHGRWEPHEHRRDPIELLIESNEGRLPDLVPIRHGRMLQSPFTFYRGSASIMAADLATTPQSGLRVCSTSAASPRRNGTWCSTSTISMKRFLRRGNGTSSD